MIIQFPYSRMQTGFGKSAQKVAYGTKRAAGNFVINRKRRIARAILVGLKGTHRAGGRHSEVEKQLKRDRYRQEGKGKITVRQRGRVENGKG